MSSMITASVCISRNIADLPFSGSLSGAQKDNLTQRMLGTVKELEGGFRYIPFSVLTEKEKEELISKGLCGEETLSARFDGCFFINAANSICISVGEEDHVRIRSAGIDLRRVFNEARETACLLSDKLVFAYNDRFGYLTACPVCAGTAMSIGAYVHLPFISRASRNADYALKAAANSLKLTPVHPEDPRNQGDLYLLATAFSLGFTEDDLFEKMCTVLELLSNAEQELSLQSTEDQQLILEDSVYRSLALLQSARILTRGEFLKNWSSVCAGSACGIPGLVSLPCCDLLYTGLHAPFEPFTANPKEDTAILAGRAAAVRSFMKKENIPCL